MIPRFADPGLPKMPESALQAAVLQLAPLYGFTLTIHFTPSMVNTPRGPRWVTAQHGVPGWPDLVLLQEEPPYRLLHIEFKGYKWNQSKGKWQLSQTSRDQKRWLAALGQAGREAYLFTPDDLDSGEIMRVLKG